MDFSGSTVFVNGRQCIDGTLVEGPLYVDRGGQIAKESTNTGHNVIDLNGGIIAPGFIELQTNGVHGFHFTHFEHAQSYNEKLQQTAQYYVTQGVTGFYPTIPTVSSDNFKKVLPHLHPRDVDGGASILGAHCEGPYLHPSKKGAHDASLFQTPSTPFNEIYGDLDSISLVTLAPELPDSATLIRDLTDRRVRVSLGHSMATYDEAVRGLEAGATCITHLFNAMSGLHHRDPGLPGVVGLPMASLPSNQGSSKAPHFSMIPDGHHVHPSVVALMFRSAPRRAIMVSDSTELLGLPDGIYPGHAQIPYNQVKQGTRVVIERTDTLIGGCCSLQQGIRNLMKWSNGEIGIAQAVRAVTENVAELMGLNDRGKLETGRRGDLVLLDDDGKLRSTWVKGRKVFEASKA